MKNYSPPELICFGLIVFLFLYLLYHGGRAALKYFVWKAQEANLNRLKSEMYDMDDNPEWRAFSGEFVEEVGHKLNIDVESTPLDGQTNVFGIPIAYDSRGNTIIQRPNGTHIPVKFDKYGKPTLGMVTDDVLPEEIKNAFPEEEDSYRDIPISVWDNESRRAYDQRMQLQRERIEKEARELPQVDMLRVAKKDGNSNRKKLKDVLQHPLTPDEAYIPKPFYNGADNVPDSIHYFPSSDPTPDRPTTVEDVLAAGGSITPIQGSRDEHMFSATDNFGGGGAGASYDRPDTNTADDRTPDYTDNSPSSGGMDD